jgi:uncharacterized protein (TIGR02646 family)
MRRCQRLNLGSRDAGYLAKRQAKLDADLALEPRAVWQSSRGTKTIRRVAETLAKMAGDRSRCMFCSDSRGTDIDHFWPLAAYRDRVFSWPNMLWACTGCNRAKSASFALANGTPLLLNPTIDDPWDHLFFDPTTCNVVPRFDPAARQENPRGKFTVDHLPLNDEAVTNGRAASLRTLCASIEHFRQKLAAGENLLIASDALRQRVLDAPDRGLAQWFILNDGKNDHPFTWLRVQHPDTWLELSIAVL